MAFIEWMNQMVDHTSSVVAYKQTHIGFVQSSSVGTLTKRRDLSSTVSFSVFFLSFSPR